MRSKRTPKAYAHHINWGFSTRGQRWPSDKVLYKRSVGPGLLHLIKALTVLIVINFLIRSVGTSVWICLLFLYPLMFSSHFFFNNTSSLHSNGWNLFLLWFKLHLIVSVTGALSYQGLLHPQKSRGASSKLGRDWLNNSGLRSSAW